MASCTRACGLPRCASETYDATDCCTPDTLHEPQLANHRAFGVFAIFASAAFRAGSDSAW